MNVQRWIGLTLLALLVGCSSNSGPEEECVLPPRLNPEEIAALNEGEGKVFATVFYSDQVTEEDREFLRSLEARLIYEWQSRPAIAIEVPEKNLEAIDSHPRVDFVVEAVGGNFALCSGQG